MKKVISFVVVACVVFVAVIATHTLYRAGAFAEIEARGNPPTAVITGFVGGTEDIVFRGDGRHAFVSSGDFRDPSIQGAIYLIDTHAPDKPPLNVTGNLPFAFVPHGIDLWNDGATERLFVVNHGRGSGFTPSAGDAQGTHTVELFDVAPGGELTHVRTVADQLIKSPNDVAAVGLDSFYVTNDHGLEEGFWRTVEDYLRLPLGSVVFFDGVRSTRGAGGLRYPNGVAFDAERSLLFVAETTGGGFRTFAVDRSTGALEQTGRVDDPIGLDNLDLDATGAIWGASHPKLFDFVAHAADPARRSAFIVWRFWGHGERREEVFVDTGELASGASIAARGDGVFVVGTVFEPKVLVFSTQHLSNP